MPKFRKKPVVIEAWQWNETTSLRALLEREGMKPASHDGHRDRPDECTNLHKRTDALYVVTSDVNLKSGKQELINVLAKRYADGSRTYWKAEPCPYRPKQDHPCNLSIVN